MKDFFLRNKTFLGLTLGTLAILFGGVYFFSKTVSPNTKVISSEILAPKDAQVTGGIVDGKYISANASPKITLVEFGDYECPACSAYNSLVKQVITEFSGEINYVFRNYPLPQHKNAPISSYAAEAAGIQGKFWEMHNKLYDTQGAWANTTEAKSIFIGYAKDMGLDVSKFTSDIDSQKIKDKITRDESDGKLVNLTATPTFYINGVKVENLPASYDEFKKIIENALKNAPLPSGSASEAYHVHFDIKTYINNSPIDFSLSKYQNNETNPLNNDIHFHDGVGKVVHVHKEGVPISNLFDSFQLTFSQTDRNTLKVYVNGSLNSQGLAYIPVDLDKILVSFGPEEDKNIQKQLSSVSNDACIYSLKCTERGTPPPEGCSGGVGSECETE